MRKTSKMGINIMWEIWRKNNLEAEQKIKILKNYRMTMRSSRVAQHN